MAKQVNTQAVNTLAQVAQALAANTPETDSGESGEKVSRRVAERARIAAGTARGNGGRFVAWGLAFADLASQGVAQATFAQVSAATAPYTNNGKGYRAGNNGETASLLSSWRSTIGEAKKLGYVPGEVGNTSTGFDLSSHPDYVARKAPSKAPSKAAKA